MCVREALVKPTEATAVVGIMQPLTFGMHHVLVLTVAYGS